MGPFSNPVPRLTTRSTEGEAVDLRLAEHSLHLSVDHDNLTVPSHDDDGTGCGVEDGLVQFLRSTALGDFALELSVCIELELVERIAALGSRCRQPLPRLEAGA